MQTDHETGVEGGRDGTAPAAHGVPTTGRAWPDLIVDRGCLELFAHSMSGQLAGYSPLPLDVSSLLGPGAGGASILVNATAVMLGARTNDGAPSYEAIQRLRSLAPQVGIYVLVTSAREIRPWTHLLAVAGVDEVIAADAPRRLTPRSHTIRHRLAAPAPETEMRLLWRWFRDSPERSLVMHCLRNACWHDDWELRSIVFGQSRKTLQNRLAALDQLSPGLIVRCGRMLHVQELERRGVRPIGHIATVLGFPSRAALLRARQRLREVLMERGSQGMVFASLLR